MSQIIVTNKNANGDILCPRTVADAVGGLPDYQNRIKGLGNAIGMCGRNQLVKNGNFADTSSWSVSDSRSTLTVNNNVGTFTHSGVGTYVLVRNIGAATIPTGHKVFFCGNLSASVGTVKCSLVKANLNTQEYSFGGSSFELIITLNFDCVGVGCYNTGVTASDNSTIVCSNFMLIDLTALFGAGNEPTTVAEFRAMFPADYYPYYDFIKVYQDFGTWAGTTSFSYTGKSYTIPANTIYSLDFYSIWYSAVPNGIALSNSSTSIADDNPIVYNEKCSHAYISGRTGSSSRTIYYWARFSNASTANGAVQGWLIPCI